ncbi:hypothetical protein [Bradyrhizobium embrapense]
MSFLLVWAVLDNQITPPPAESKASGGHAGGFEGRTEDGRNTSLVVVNETFESSTFRSDRSTTAIIHQLR